MHWISVRFYEIGDIKENSWLHAYNIHRQDLNRKYTGLKRQTLNNFSQTPRDWYRVFPENGSLSYSLFHIKGIFGVTIVFYF